MRILILFTLLVFVMALSACQSNKDLADRTGTDKPSSGERIEKQVEQKALPAQRIPTGREVPAQAQKQIEQANQ